MKIKDNVTGKTYEIQFEGDTLPTDAEIEEALGLLHQNISPASKQERTTVPVKDIAKNAMSYLNPFQKATELSKKPALQETVKNAPGSAGNLVSGVAGAVMHPVQTATGLSQTAIGGAEKLIPGTQPDEAVFDAVIESMVKNRYGSIENLQKTVQSDPMGFLADASALLGGSGAALRLAGRISKIGKLWSVGSGVVAAGAAIDPFTQGIRGAGMAVEGVGKINPFGKNVDAPVAEAARRTGIELPASATSKNTFLPQVEAAASKSYFGQRLVKVVDTAKTNIRKLIDDAISKTDRSPDPEIGGRALVDGIENSKANFDKTKSVIYEEVGKLGGYKLDANMDKTLSTLDDIIRRKSQSGAPNEVSFFRQIRDRLVRGKLGRKEVIPGDYMPVPQGYEQAADMARRYKSADEFEQAVSKPMFNEWSQPDVPALPASPKDFWKMANTKSPDQIRYVPNFGNLKATRSDVGKRLKGGDPLAIGNRSELESLYAALSDDMDNTITTQSPEAALKIKEANEYFKENVNLFNGKLGKKIQSIKDKPSMIVPLITSKAVAVEDVPKLIKMVGADKVEDLQAVVMGRILKKAMSRATDDLKANGISTAMDSIGMDKLQAILTPEQLRTLSDAKQLQRGLSKVGGITGGSQTSFVLRLMSEMSLAFMNPALAIKLIAADAGFSGLVASKAGQKFLREGKDFAPAGRRMQKSTKIGRAALVGYEANKTREQ